MICHLRLCFRGLVGNRMTDGYLEEFVTLPSKGKHLTDVISMAKTAHDGLVVTSYTNFLDQEESIRAEEVLFLQGSKYEAPLEKKIYEFRKCVDVKLFDEYVIISGDNHVIKIPSESNYITSHLWLDGAGKMAKIRGSRNVAIIQTKPPNIAVISTKRHLKVLFRISTTELQHVSHYRLPAYNCICFLGILKYENFCVAYSGKDGRGRQTEFVDAVTRGPRERGTPYQQPVYEAKKTSFPVNLLVGMTCMDAFSEDEFIIGYTDAIASYQCLKRSIRKTQLFENWSKPVRKGVTSVCCHRDRIYVSIKREKRVMVLDRCGNVMFLNVIPNSYIISPRSVSVYGNTIAVSEHDRVLGVSKVYVLELREI